MLAGDFMTYQPMKLLVWLWNPWPEYAITRHNVWFLALDEIVHQYDGTDFLYNKKFKAELATGMIGKRQVLYAKPQTYMNKSWTSVQALANFYGIESEDILVIHDDIDHMFGKIKLKFRGSHGGHNGIRDIIDNIGGQKFRRLKLWVGRPSGTMDVSAYVLGKMKDDEMKYRSDHMPDIFEQVEMWLKNVG
jgi:peptidyl-tRNA hydrolase, PTH1 family